MAGIAKRCETDVGYVELNKSPKLNILPLVSCVLLFLSFIFFIVVTASADAGWAVSTNTDPTCEMGWREYCCGGFCLDNGDVDTDLADAGDAALACGVIGMLWTVFGFYLSISLVVGMGFFFIQAIVTGFWLLIGTYVLNLPKIPFF